MAVQASMKTKHGNKGNKNAAKLVTLNASFGARCLLSEKKAWEKCAGDQKLNDWIKDVLNREAAKT